VRNRRTLLTDERINPRRNVDFDGFVCRGREIPRRCYIKSISFGSVALKFSGEGKLLIGDEVEVRITDITNADMGVVRLKGVVVNSRDELYGIRFSRLELGQYDAVLRMVFATGDNLLALPKLAANF